MAAENDERIETYINRNGIQGDTDFFREKLNEINDLYTKLASFRLTLNKDNSFQGAIDTTGKLQAGMTKLTTAVDGYKNIQAQATQAAQLAAAAYSVGSDGILKQASSLVSLRLALQQNQQLQKDYKKQLDDGSLSLDQYQAKTAAAIITQKEYQASIASLNKELSNAAKASLPGQPAANTPISSISVPSLDADQEAIKKGMLGVTELDKAEAQAAITAREWAAAQKAAGVSAEESSTFERASVGPLETTARLLAQQKLSLSENAVAQKEYAEQLKAGQLTQDQYTANMAKAILEANELKLSIKALNTELANAAKAELAPPGSQAAASAANVQLKAERINITAQPGLASDEDLARIKELNDLIDANDKLLDDNSSRQEKFKINVGNYPTVFKAAFTTLNDELGKVNTSLEAPGLSGKELDELTLKQTALKNVTGLVSQEFATSAAQANAYKESAKQVGQVFGTDSEFFKQYAVQVAAGTAESKKLGDEVENAGKKSNLFVSGFKNIYSTLRQIAQAIPGIGLAGLIGLLLEPLASLASSLFNVGGKTVDLKDKQAILHDTLKKTSEVLDELGASASSGALEVDNLRNHIDQAKKGLVDSNDVVELYNSTIGKTTGAVASLGDAEEQLAKKGDAYIKYTFLKAAAQLAAAKGAAALLEAEEAAEKPTQDFNTVGSRFKSFGAGQVSSPGAVPGGSAVIDAGLQARNDAAKKAQDDAVKQKQNEADEFNKIEKKFVDDYNAIAAQLGLNIDGKAIVSANEAAITAIDTQIQALTQYQNKQEQVAQTDTNTYEKRRQALLNYNKTAVQILDLQEQLSLVGVTDVNKIDQADSKLYTAKQKAAIDGYEKLRALDESYRQRKLTAEEQTAEDQINEVIKANEAVYKDEQQTLQARLAAYQAYIEAQKSLADKQKDEKLASAGFSQQEITDFNNGLQVQLQGKKITNEELIALETDYQVKVANLTANGAKEVYDITTSYAKRTADELKNLNKGNLDTSVTEAYVQDLQALNISFQLKIISATQYLAKRKQLDRAYAQDQYQAQIDAANTSLALDKEYEQELNAQIAQAAADLIAAKEAGSQEEIRENQARLDALKKAEQKNADDILAIQEKKLKDEEAKRKAAEDKELEDAQKENDQEIVLLKTTIAGIATIVDQRYDNEKAQIQATIDAINKKAQTDIAAENASADSAQVKQEKIEIINERAAAKTAQLAAQQKEIDQKKARFDKAKAIADIVINTAVAITKVMDDPFLIALIAATGAIEAAVVAATPIPTYKYGAGVNGRPKHPGGDAIVGDGGKPELAITPAGDLIVTPATPTKMFFPRDTTVLPDANVAIDAIIYSHLRSLTTDEPQQDDRLLQSNRQLQREIRRLQTIVAGKQETHVHTTWQGLEQSYRSGSNWMKFIDERVNWKL